MANEIGNEPDSANTTLSSVLGELFDIGDAYLSTKAAADNRDAASANLQVAQIKEDQRYNAQAVIPANTPVQPALNYVNQLQNLSLPVKLAIGGGIAAAVWFLVK